MVTKAIVGMLLATVIVALLVSPAWPQTSTRPNDVPPKKERPSLFEFAAKGVNGNDLNYAQCIDEGRHLAIENTIQRGYFWSNLLAVAVACFLLMIVVHHRKVQVNREQVAATALAQYHNALARANSQIAEATVKNHALMQMLMARDLPVFEMPRSESKTHPQPPQVSDKQSKSSAASAQSAATNAVLSSASAKVEKALDADRITIADIPAENAKTAKPSIKTAAGSDVDLVAKVNSLQQQLGASQEREKQLRRQLNSAEVRLQKEQQRNQTLKSD